MSKNSSINQSQNDRIEINVFHNNQSQNKHSQNVKSQNSPISSPDYDIQGQHTQFQNLMKGNNSSSPMIIDSPTDFLNDFPKLSSTQKSSHEKLEQIFETSVIEQMSKSNMKIIAKRCIQNIFRTLKLTGVFPERRVFGLIQGLKKYLKFIVVTLS